MTSRPKNASMTENSPLPLSKPPRGCRPDRAARPAKASLFVIDNVTLIDGSGIPTREHMRVAIKDNQIEFVEPVGTAPGISSEAFLIDGAGKYLIPGLWDAHLHLADIGEVGIPVLVTYGITSVRDMGGDIPRLKAWRSKIEKGELLGPRITYCGPMLEGKWDPTSVGGRTDHWAVATSDQALAVVNQLADEGVDCIKIRSYASPETYFALAAAAQQRGLPLVGHAPWGIDPVQSSSAGQRSYEHAYYPWPWKDLAADQKAEIERTFRKNGSVIVPTLIAWESFRLPPDQIATVVNDYEGKSDRRLKVVSSSLRKNWFFGVKDMELMNAGSPGWNESIDQLYEQIAEMHDHGVGMMAGTDTGTTLVYPGSALHQELKLLVHKCHFTPLDALLSATLIPATFFKTQDRLGTIEEGKLADLVLLFEDPLRDITNSERICGVMVNESLAGSWCA